MWQLEHGVELARRAEGVVIPLGYHVCLGGSVLHSGESKKDLDLFICLYDRSNAEQEMVDIALKKLEEIGFLPDPVEEDMDIAPSSCPGNQYCFRRYFENKRVDIFFLEKRV